MKTAKIFVLAILAILGLGFVLAGCSEKNKESVPKNIAIEMPKLVYTPPPQDLQSVVLELQAAAKGVAKNVVAENHLIQTTACNEIPARLAAIKDFNIYPMVASGEYMRECRYQVVSAKAKDRADRIATKLALAKHQHQNQKIADGKVKQHPATNRS
jgi:hypothetical protein